MLETGSGRSIGIRQQKTGSILPLELSEARPVFSCVPCETSPQQFREYKRHMSRGSVLIGLEGAKEMWVSEETF